VLRVTLVGTVEVTVDGARVQLPPGRATELLAWLAAHPGVHARNRLAPIFWPDVSDATSRASLRTALWSLRRALGDAADGVLIVERSTVGLEGEGLSVDLREVRDLGPDDLDAALAAPADGVLPGIEAEWADELRDAHRAALVELLVRAGERAGAAGALAAARRLTELDPYSEDHHRLLLRRLVDAGDQATALREHDRFRRRLWDDLKVRPSPATRDAVAQLTVQRRDEVAELPSRLARARRDAFVAREAELAKLERVWTGVAGGRGPHVVIVSGEAGIGKTSLVARFADDVLAAGGVVLFGAAAEDELLPAEPFLEAIGEHHALDPQELVDLVRSRIEAVAVDRPVLLVLDDLQWADTVSIAALRRLARGSARRLLVLGSYRSDGDGRERLASLAVELARDGQLDRIDLDRLSTEETSALLGALDPSGALVAHADALHADTGGNPLFVHELGRYLLDVPSDRRSRAPVPDSIRDLVVARLRGLRAEAGEVLGAAAVLGTVASHAVLGSMLGSDPLAHLEDGAALGLLDEQAAGAHAFRHAVVRDAVYANLSKSRRADLHRRAADALLDVAGDDPGAHLCDIAEHRCAACPPDPPVRAVDAARVASAWAIDNHAYDRAVVVLTKALGVVAVPSSRRELQVKRAIAYARLGHMQIDLPSG
jgi:DNA-binding SARP family transcriptional activator